MRKRLIACVVLVLPLLATFAVGGHAEPAAPLGLIADHAGEQRVPPGHPVMDGQMPFWMNMPNSMARGGNGRPVPLAVIPYQAWLALKNAIGHRLPASEALTA